MFPTEGLVVCSLETVLFMGSKFPFVLRQEQIFKAESRSARLIKVPWYFLHEILPDSSREPTGP